MRLAPIFVVILLALPGLAAAYPDPDKVPRYYDSDCTQTHDRRFVHDYLGVLPLEYATEMEGAACEVYATTSAHYVFVSVHDTEGESLENYAFHLFETWGIGDKERLDGLLMIYVADYLDSGEGAIRIEVGYGLEGVLNSIVTEEAWSLMIDARDSSLEAGHLAEEARALAIGVGTLYLLGTLQDGHVDGAFPEPEPRSPPILFWVIVILVVILVIYLLSKSSRGRRGWGYHPTSSAWSSRSSSVWTPGGGGFGGGGRGGRF